MDADRGRLSRRQFLQYGAAAGLTLVRVPVARGQSTCTAPPGFPSGIELYQEGFENWSGEIVLEDLWTCAPRSPGAVGDVANWAHRAGWQLRARGMRHNWSPLGPALGTTCESRVLLVDTTRYLRGVSVRGDGVVRVGAGETMDVLVGQLEAAGRGFMATTAPGGVTLGGVIAIDGHGSAIPAVGESPRDGTTYGSFSNLVTAVDVVAWSPRADRYKVRRVERDDPRVRPLLTNLGSCFTTAIELRTATDVNLRCRSFTDIPWTELCGSSGRSFESFLDSAGRAELIWFPFTDNPWLKVWSVAPSQPAGSRLTQQPYNYTFSDNIPNELAALTKRLTEGDPAAAPLVGQLSYEVVHGGLDATRTRDLWGRSKNTLLYVRPTTLRYVPGSWAVHCARQDVQGIVSRFMREHAARIAEHRGRGEYPINGPVEIRVTGIDRPGDVGIEHGITPAFSALRRRRREWDTVVWLSVLGFVGTPGLPAYLRETERRLYASHPGAVTPEWSKGWAYSDAGAWRDAARFPRLSPTAQKTLRRLDPGKLFTSPFLDKLIR